MIASRALLVTLLAGLATALPHGRRDSSINEPAVSAPNGSPITAGTQPMATAADNGSAGSSMSMNMDMSSSAEMSSSTEMASDTTVVISQATTTTAAWNSYQTPTYQPPTYGSGSSNWGSSSNYNDCVSQCLAQYGGSPQPWTPPPTQTTSGSSVGNGVTHTVIVAPSQGVLRYVPFAVNASVGDTVKFMWGADTHTVTKGSELGPCNATADSPFASGIQKKDFIFEQLVNDTNPTFFHCAVPTHCQKGMFGIINPASNFGSGTSVSLMMSEWAASNPDLAAYSAVTSNLTQNNVAASRWGGNIDVANLPDWSQPLVAENVLYTRSFLASNPETMNTDGSVDLSKSAGTPLMIPQDISVALSNANTDGAAGASSSAAAPPSVAPTSSAAPATSASAASNLTNGAATTSPKFVVAVVAAIAGFFLL